MIDFYEKLLRDISKLHIDIETFSSEDLKSAGAYRYAQAVDFEILIIAYAFDDKNIEIIDLAAGEKIPELFIRALKDPRIKKCAHNAQFERTCFKAYGWDIPIEQWECTLVKAAYCGLPLGLDQASTVLKLDNKKDAAGKALIRYFCIPCKPTRLNGQRTRNLYKHDLDKWTAFKLYCIGDVAAERDIDKALEHYPLPLWEVANYILDQKINDRGVLVDVAFAKAAIELDDLNSKLLREGIKEIAAIDNPNSPAQLKEWMQEVLEREILSLAKGNLESLISELDAGPVLDVLHLRKMIARTSIKKYSAMIKCVGYDNRARGLFQFYGANRTGRWAGRLIQLQNLKRNYLKLLELARDLVKSKDYEILALLFSDVSDVLSQLIRTSFIPSPGTILAVADFSAIEARVIAWLANEKWRLDVFATHGKIYEASAAIMFNIPIESIGKGSDLRFKGKVAELSLGYQGALGALKKMGGEAMGLSDGEMTSIVKLWRKANPAIVALWKDVENCAIEAVSKPGPQVISRNKGLVFHSDGKVFTIRLPSGRKLFYQSPSLKPGAFGKKVVGYKGIDQTIKQWVTIDTYGGKLVENIVQAIARDLLVYAMQKLDKAGFDLIMHIHDEVVAEVKIEHAAKDLEAMNKIMGEPVPWAQGLPLTADGYLTPFYKKD